MNHTWAGNLPVSSQIGYRSSWHSNLIIAIMRWWLASTEPARRKKRSEKRRKKENSPLARLDSRKVSIVDLSNTLVQLHKILSPQSFNLSALYVGKCLGVLVAVTSPHSSQSHCFGAVDWRIVIDQTAKEPPLFAARIACGKWLTSSCHSKVQQAVNFKSIGCCLQAIGCHRCWKIWRAPQSHQLRSWGFPGQLHRCRHHRHPCHHP